MGYIWLHATYLKYKESPTKVIVRATIQAKACLLRNSVFDIFCSPLFKSWLKCVTVPIDL